ncbi:hypothetical protein ACRAWD_12215 [Caulobacter segnis]
MFIAVMLTTIVLMGVVLYVNKVGLAANRSSAPSAPAARCCAGLSRHGRLSA